MGQDSKSQELKSENSQSSTPQTIYQNETKQASLEQALALLKFRLNRWAKLDRPEVQQVIGDVKKPQSSVYVELFGEEKSDNFGCVGLEQFKQVMHHALEKLSDSKQIERLNQDGYLYFKKSPLPAGTKELPKDFLACTYEIYKDHNGHFILVLQPHGKEAMRKDEQGNWKRPKKEFRKKTIGSFKKADQSFAVGSDIEHAFTLTSRRWEATVQMPQESESARVVNSPFVQRSLVGKLHKGGFFETGTMNMVVPKAIGDIRCLNSATFRDEHGVLLAITSAARGVMALHEAGWTHDDLRSDNVVLMPNGMMPLIDLGLAKKIQSTLPVLKQLQKDVRGLVELVMVLLRKIEFQQTFDKKFKELYQSTWDLLLLGAKGEIITIKNFLSKLEDLFPDIMPGIHRELDQYELEWRRNPGVFAVSAPTQHEELFLSRGEPQAQLSPGWKVIATKRLGYLGFFGAVGSGAVLGITTAAYGAGHWNEAAWDKTSDVLTQACGIFEDVSIPVYGVLLTGFGLAAMSIMMHAYHGGGAKTELASEVIARFS